VALGIVTGAQSVARVEQFQRCDWTSRAVARRPVPIPVPATPPPAVPAPPTPPNISGVVARDTTAPTLTVAGIPASITRAKLLRSGLSVRVTSSEATSLRGMVQSSAARYELALGSKALPLGAGTRTLKLKPTSRLFAARDARSPSGCASKDETGPAT